MRWLSTAWLAASLTVGALFAWLPANAQAQSPEFMQHKERLRRLTLWTLDNPHLDAGITEIIVRRERLAEQVDDPQDTVVTRIVFYNRVFFDFNRSRLTRKGDEVIETIAAMIASEPTPPALLIAGHTDSTGPESYNFRLSSDRANTVAFGFADDGVLPDVIHVIGMGEIQPISSSRTKNGRAINRRIELYLSTTQAANEIAAAQAPFDPCHRNDHPGAGAAERCGAEKQTVTVDALAGKGRLKATDRVIDLGR